MIAILAGDGIGPEITAQAVAVLMALERDQFIKFTLKEYCC